MSNSSLDDNQSMLKVAFPSTKAALAYEPTKIHLGNEYIFLENIFSPLFEINPIDGQIMVGLAKSFEWQGDDLIIEIRTDSKTVSGRVISAEDVEFSLKRLLVLSGNTHGNFKDLVCPNSPLHSINENCEGIVRDNNKIILKAGKRKSFLIPMLAAIDFAVIPKSSADSKSLAIINARETSGPYYVDKDDGNGNITLKANPNHYRFSKQIPQTIQLIPVNVEEKSAGLVLFDNKKVDHLTTIDSSAPEDILEYAEKHKNDLTLHTTHRIRNLSFVFTEKGTKKFSQSHRHRIGSLFRKAMTEILKGKPAYQSTDEFFSPLAEGGLSLEQKKQISEISFERIEKENSGIKIGIIRNSDISPWKNQILKFLPNAKIYQETNVPDFKKYVDEEDKPDAFVASTDTGFSEDINLISYTLAAGFFGLTKDQRQKWLAEYMEHENKAARIDKLNKIHFAALKDGILIPIGAAPFVAIVRKPWRMELSELCANNPIWLIKQ